MSLTTSTSGAFPAAIRSVGPRGGGRARFKGFRLSAIPLRLWAYAHAALPGAAFRATHPLDHVLKQCVPARKLCQLRGPRGAGVSALAVDDDEVLTAAIRQLVDGEWWAGWHHGAGKT